MTNSHDPNGEVPEVPEKLLHLLKTLEPPEVEPSLGHFQARVWARIAQQQTRQRFGWRTAAMWRPALALVPIAVLVLSLSFNGWFVYQTFTLRQQLATGLTTRGDTTGTAERVLQGDYAASAGHFAEAVQIYEAALQTSGAPIASILIKQAGALIELGQYAQAYEAASAALFLAPQEARAYWYRGKAAEALGDQRQAAEDWRQAARRGDREAQRALYNVPRKLDR